MKRALVTGGSGDIGSAIAFALAKAGHFVYVHANNNLSRAEEVAAEINHQAGAAKVIKFDICKPSETQKAVETMLEDGPIQILVNNAGIHNDAVLAGMQPEQWREVIDVNLNGFYNIKGNRGQANYAAAKAGLIGATKSMSLEMASRGITANAVAPGIISGVMTEKIFDKSTIKQLVPAQREGTPQEVAALVSFLASEEAGYITGQVIGINGGME